MGRRNTSDECAIQGLRKHLLSQMKRPNAFFVSSGAGCHVRWAKRCAGVYTNDLPSCCPSLWDVMTIISSAADTRLLEGTSRYTGMHCVLRRTEDINSLKHHPDAAKERLGILCVPGWRSG